MIKTTVLSFLVLGAAAFAAGNTFKVSFAQDSVIAGKTFKAGDYKILLENGNAVIKQGKQSVAVPAHEVDDPDKVESTELTYRDNTNLTEIRIGGSHTKIIFDGASGTQTGM
jgi:hypothetical protein